MALQVAQKLGARYHLTRVLLLPKAALFGVPKGTQGTQPSAKPRFSGTGSHSGSMLQTQL